MHTLEEKIEQGQLALDQGNIEDAHKLLTEVITENAEKWRAWRGLGFANIELGKFDDAVVAFGKATLIRPDDVQSQYGSGIAFQKVNDNAKAIKSFEEALRHDHKHADSKKAISESLLAQVQHMRDIGNLLAVEEYLEKAHKYYPENEDVTIQLFRYYEQTGQSSKLDVAITDLKRHDIPVPEREAYSPVAEVDETADMPTTLDELTAYVASNHEKWQAWRAIGNLQLEAGNAQAAHDAFKTATVMRSDDPESQFGYGRALQELDDHSHAIHAFEEAIRHNKNHYPDAKKALTKSLMAYVDNMREIGNLLAVEQFLERAHKNDITDEHVTAQLLGYYDETGQGGKKHVIIKDLTTHGLAVPEPSMAGKMSAMPSDGKQDGEEDVDLNTIEELEKHLESKGEDWRNWRKLGFAYLDANRPQDAAAVFKKATVIRFDDADSQYGFGLSHQKMGDHAHAIHPFEEAIRQDPKHTKAIAALKESLLRYCDNMREIGNLLAIEQFLEKAFKCDPSAHAVGKQLFEYYRETGQGGKAAKIAQEIGLVGEDVPVAGAPPAASGSDDLLLPQERQYQPEDADIAATGPKITQQAPSDVPEMLPCPGCKQMMPSRSRICPHCSRMVDAIGGIVLLGSQNDSNKKPESKSSAGKRSGCGSVMMTIVFILIILGAVILSGIV